MNCEFCEIIEGKGKAEILYQDADIVIAVRDNVVAPGQITVFPKKHLPILEMVPNSLLEKCATMANKVSIALFEGLSGQGTNVIVKNGLGAGQSVPHFAIEIIPRVENDGLNLQWEPKQASEDELEMTYELIMKEAKGLSLDDNVLAEESVTEKKVEDGSEKEDSESKKETKKEEKENYMIKQLKRMP